MTEPTPNPAELSRLIKRTKETERKRRQRDQQAEKRAHAALALNPGGFTVPPMPAGLSAIRKWVRRAHDAYSKRAIGPFELAEIRRSASSVGDLYRTGAELQKAEAALRAAETQERMAEALAAVEQPSSSSRRPASRSTPI